MATKREIRDHLVNLEVKLEKEGNIDWNDIVVPISDASKQLALLIDRTNQLLRQLLVSSERARVGDDAPTPHP